MFGFSCVLIKRYIEYIFFLFYEFRKELINISFVYIYIFKRGINKYMNINYLVVCLKFNREILFVYLFIFNI